MPDWKNEAEAREQIRAFVAAYYHNFKEKKEKYTPGERISYASRIFDEKEMQSLVDAALDFWLTTGHYAEQFHNTLKGKTPLTASLSRQTPQTPS